MEIFLAIFSILIYILFFFQEINSFRYKQYNTVFFLQSIAIFLFSVYYIFFTPQSSNNIRFFFLVFFACLGAEIIRLFLRKTKIYPAHDFFSLPLEYISAATLILCVIYQSTICMILLVLLSFITRTGWILSSIRYLLLFSFIKLALFYNIGAPYFDTTYELTNVIFLLALGVPLLPKSIPIPYMNRYRF
jgi:hypothetical protein